MWHAFLCRILLERSGFGLNELLGLTCLRALRPIPRAPKDYGYNESCRLLALAR